MFPCGVVINCWAVECMLAAGRNLSPIANIPIAATAKKNEIKVPRSLYA